MPSLSIKNVPDDLLARLRARARENHRSLQGELMSILEQAVSPRTLSVSELARRVKERGIHTGDEAVTMLREDRDAR